MVSESAGSNEGTRLLMGQLPASCSQPLVGRADPLGQQRGETAGAIRFTPVRLSSSSWRDDVFNWIKASPRKEPVVSGLDELPNTLTSRWLPICRGHIRPGLSTFDDVSICVSVCMRSTAGTRRG